MNKNNDEVVAKIDRNNPEEYLRALQLNPFADADESMFKEEVSL